MTPKEALSQAVDAAWFLPRLIPEGPAHKPGKPGLFVSRLSHEIREALKGLTSEDAAHVDADWVVKRRVG